MTDITHAQLTKAVGELAKDIARTGDATHAFAASLSDEAQDTARVGNCIGAIRVDTATVAETAELAKILDGLSAHCRAYAASGEYVVSRAKAVREQNRASHTGIGQAAARSPVGRQIYDVDRGWLRQE